MAKLRKVNRAKRKKEARAQEQLAQQTSLMLRHPKECCICTAPFERTKETVSTWMVTVREERVRLTCPACWATVQKVVQCQE